MRAMRVTGCSTHLVEPYDYVSEDSVESGNAMQVHRCIYCGLLFTAPVEADD